MIDEKRLLAEAAEALTAAHAPYSGFRVGAALLAADGRVYRGCNVENVSYGLTICAERSALCIAVSDGCGEFAALAVVASGKEPPYPCGACRQALAEFCDADLPVWVAPADNLDNVRSARLGELLPHAFKL